MKSIVFLALFLLLILSGCVKQMDPNPMILEAKRLIDGAKAGKADVYAPVNLEVAEKDLARAESELSKGDRDRAYQWARRAQADAELAAALAKGSKLEEETKAMSETSK